MRAVYAAHGWIYNNGNFHGAVDYLKTSESYGPGIDPAFRVHAIAAGRVVTVVFDAHSGLSDADWDAKWQEYVEDGPYRVEDRTAYEVGGARSWVAVFVADGDKAFAEYHYMSSDSFNARAETLGDQGFMLWSVDPEELSGGMRFGAIWRKLPLSWVGRHGLSPSEYQAEFEKWSAEGYRLHRVRGYGDSERFAAVWVKP